MKKTLHSFYKKYRTDIKLGLIIVILFFFVTLIGKGMYDHDDFWYPFKNTISAFQSTFSFSDKEKGRAHLKNTQDLYQDFLRVREKNPKDMRLLVIAREMGREEAIATEYMERAEHSGNNIDEEVEILCKVLEKQQEQLKFLVMIAPDELKSGLQEALNVTDQDLQKAMQW